MRDFAGWCLVALLAIGGSFAGTTFVVALALFRDWWTGR